MYSCDLPHFISPVRVNVHNPTLHIDKPRKNGIKLKNSPQTNDIFSHTLLSLRTCTENQDANLGACSHANVLKSGIQNDVFISNSLLNMYVNCGHIQDAETVFEHMPYRTIVSWTSMMSGYCRNGLEDNAIILFLKMLESIRPNEYTLAVALQACAQRVDQDLVKEVHAYVVKCRLILDDHLQSSLINAYGKCGMSEAAERMLMKLTCRDVVSWTSVISAFVFNGVMERALMLFVEMQEDGILPNEITMCSILHACSDINSLMILRMIHGFVLKQNWCRSELVMNSLIKMYTTNGYFIEGLRVFCSSCFAVDGVYPSPESMASLLHGCGNLGSLMIGESLHTYLIKHGFLPRTIVENSLIHMYADNKRDGAAKQLFLRMSRKDIISWNTMLSCLVNNGQPMEALKLLNKIHRDGREDAVSPDFVTVLIALEACSDFPSLLHGQLVQGYIIKAGLRHDIFVQNALIDMYAKSGGVNLAEMVFCEMHEKDLSSWNSMIAAYGINGNGLSALSTFADLESSRTLNPNVITFTNVLSACAHAGLVEEGLEIFNSMEKHYCVEPSMEHFSCIVDLLARAGRLEEAENFIYKMPIKPGPDIWGALLGASVAFGNVPIAETSASVLSILQPTSTVWRVALSNAYAAAGKWHNASKVRAELRGRRELRKEVGWSSVYVGGYEIRFTAGDTEHPDSKTIFEALNGLNLNMRDASHLYDEKFMKLV